MPLDRDGLREFVESGDKSPPPVFVGREDVLSGIERHGRMAWKGNYATSQGEAGLTHVIQGAPGAGKSSILNELRERAVRAGGASPTPVPQVLVLTTGGIDGPEDILVPLAEMVMRRRGLGDGIRERTLGIAELVPRRLRAAAAELLGHRPDPDMRTWPAFGRWLDAWTGSCGLSSPVIIAIDEAQRFERTAEDPVAKLLQAIHDGHTDLPLTLVLAGLGDTLAKAHDMNLTRGTVIHEIGGLDPDDSDGLMPDFCRHFGMDPKEQADRLRDLARPCEGWPRHLHYAMQAVGSAALETDGDLARVDWRQARQKSAESRLRYYRDQQSPEMEAADLLTARVLRDLKDGMRLSAVSALIESSIEDHPGHRLPRGMDVEDFLNNLVQRGALHKRADKTFHCPIPSFRSYLVEAGARPNEPGKGQADVSTSTELNPHDADCSGT